MKGFVVIEAEADADTDIVATALNKAANQQSVAVAADDTDILVLLVHHLNDEMHDILFVPQNRRRFKQVSIRDIQQAVGKQTCRQLLAVHAIGGCDTVSAIFGIGKGTVLKRLTAGTQFIASTDVLQDRCATVEDVISEGLKLLVGVYGGKPSESLNRLRYQLYCKMATESTLRPKPQRLPPTKASAQYHIMRAHLQAVRWSMLNASALEPTEWGWRLTDDGLQPITTSQAAAPAEILNVVRCKCKTACTSSLCSCRKNGIYCVSACGNCHGDSCMNIDKDTNYSHGDVGNDSDSVDILNSEMEETIYFFDETDCQDEEIVNSSIY